MRFLVVLTSVGSQQDQLVAEIASITGKEPVECQRLIAALPAVIQICTSEAEAHGIRERLVAVGAEATVATATETEAPRHADTFTSKQDQPVNEERESLSQTQVSLGQVLSQLSLEQKLGFVGCLLLAVGIFCPLLITPIGTLTATTSGDWQSDGIFLLLFALGSALLIWYRRYGWLWVTGGLSLVVIAFDFVDIQNRIAKLRDNPFTGLIQLGWGWLVLTAGTGLILWPAIVYERERRVIPTWLKAIYNWLRAKSETVQGAKSVEKSSQTTELEAPQQRQRFCTSCGAEIKAGANFCPQCSTKQVKGESETGFMRTWYSGLQQDQKIQLWVATGLVVVILLGAFFVLTTRPGAGGGPAYNTTEQAAAQRICENAAVQAYKETKEGKEDSRIGSLADALRFVQGFIKEGRCPIDPLDMQTCLREESAIKKALSTKITFHPQDPKTLIVRNLLVVYPIRLISYREPLIPDPDWHPIIYRPGLVTDYICTVRWKMDGLWLMERLDMLGKTWRY